jgi:hypothetical protein
MRNGYVCATDRNTGRSIGLIDLLLDDQERTRWWKVPFPGVKSGERSAHFEFIELARDGPLDREWVGDLASENKSHGRTGGAVSRKIQESG